MRISDFFDLEGRASITALEAEKINEGLSEMSVNDIPTEMRAQVLNYLGSVDKVDSQIG